MANSPFYDGYRGRTTVYNGVEMRSRTEASFAALLESRGRPWTYEPKCFASGSVQWLPDFWSTVDVDVYFECKWAAPDWDNQVYDLRQQMSVAWQSEPDCTIALAMWGEGTRRWFLYQWRLQEGLVDLGLVEPDPPFTKASLLDGVGGVVTPVNPEGI